MVDKDKIKRCLELAPKIGLLEAVKKCDLDGEESAEILDLVMEAADCDKEETGESKAGLLSMVFELCERQTRLEEHFERMLNHLEGVQTQLGHFADAMHMLTDAVHPESPKQIAPVLPRLAAVEAKVIDLSNRRPPSRTPPETRKGA